MTREKWASLSDQEKQIKVAELCGWTELVAHGVGTEQFAADGFTGLHGTVPLALCSRQEFYEMEDRRKFLNMGALLWFKQRPPNYLNDLNAMHDAEKSAFSGIPNWEFESHYLENLATVRMCSGAHLYDATAAQRAEAFVVTMEGSEE